MTGEPSRFTSDRRRREGASWATQDDWAAGTGESVDIVDGGVVGRDPAESSAPPESGLYYYSFEDGELADLWGNGPTLVNNGATYTDDAYRFDGHSSQLELDEGDISELDGVRQLSMAAWVNPRTTSQPQDYPFVVSVSDGTVGSGHQDFQISFEGYSTKVRFHSPHGRPSASVDVPANETTLIVGVFDDFAGESRLYYNDTEMDVVTGSASSSTEHKDLWVGDSVFSSNNDTFDGEIYGLKWYQKALTPVEVTNLSATGRISG